MLSASLSNITIWLINFYSIRSSSVMFNPLFQVQLLDYYSKPALNLSLDEPYKHVRNVRNYKLLLSSTTDVTLAIQLSIYTSARSESDNVRSCFRLVINHYTKYSSHQSIGTLAVICLCVWWIVCAGRVLPAASYNYYNWTTDRSILLRHARDGMAFVHAVMCARVPCISGPPPPS
jgi:hypothetical protein